jgi:hypothetical protein
MITRPRLWLSLALALAGCGSSGSGTPDGGGGGSGGTGGGGPADAGGPDGASAAPCGIPEMEPNDTRDNAVVYTAGSEVVACLGTDKDVDFYEVTAPAGDAAGGYYQASITNVGMGNVDAKVFSATDNSLILQFTYTVDQGASLYFYWAAAPGQKYRVAVTNFAGWNNPYKYTFKATYQKVADAFEPNDMREAAKPLTLGTAVMPYFFTGFRRGDIKPEEYQDWFSVMLDAGMVTVKVDNVPTDVRPQIKLLDPTGAEVDLPTRYNVTPGGSLNTSAKVDMAGKYLLVVDIFSVEPDASAKEMMVPDSFTRPYTLTVSQP